MKISVVIPAYNAEKTIRATIESVLAQTVAPHEVLVYDDGSSDNTLRLLANYQPRITVLKGSRNRGLCAARNELCRRVTGDWVALIDADDVWHPAHLRVKCRLFKEFPDAAVYFVGHMSFSGFGDYEWKQGDPEERDFETEVMDSLAFFRRYNRTPGFFYPSVCSFSRKMLKTLGETPFQTAAEDAYFLYTAILSGPVIYQGAPLAAIRVLPGSLSSNRINVYRGQVEAFALLKQCYEERASTSLRRAFHTGFSDARRQYAKRLMGARNVSAARKELWKSVGSSLDPASAAKSAGLLAASFLPVSFQPLWPSPFREDPAQA